ncbi:MAG: hypothetical protein S4CHLAM81_15080 [Chlamydiales bacterium]|nr:hypothetical protein [Chlamydiales bacterium]MCH9636277.1 hypothetical protein [Chlamydiales bacterium]MCH9703166.1 type III secretion inner membrane ring lipoprotein SctJ [Chlamydiota bacterium]
MIRKLLLFTPLLLLFGCNTRSTIANNLSERDANEIVVLLNSRGVVATKIEAAATTVGGGGGPQMWDISVPAKQITDSLTILNQAGLPRVRGTNLLDLFGNQGLVPSDMQNRIRYQEGLSMQLANTIRTMDGIIDANVQITLPHEDEDEQQTLTASVYVKHRGILDNPNSLLVTKIKRLVASAVPGLEIDNVSVVSDRALYSDITLEQVQRGEELSYVSVWGVTVARGSVSLLRGILYTFILVIFVLACLLLWTAWKTLTIIRYHGWKRFFELEPFEVFAPPHEEPEEEVGGEI